MWDWLVHNKEWIFSGIGVVVLGWIFKRRGSRQGASAANAVTQAPANTVAQAPTVTQSPTININVSSQSGEPPKQEPPHTPPPPVPRANLKIEATKVGRVYLHGSVFRLPEGPYNSGDRFRMLVVDIANVPISGKIKAVTVRAALTIRDVSYSPLPWLGEYTNTVTLEPAMRKTLIVAVGQDKQMGEWHFVLNHRDTYTNTPLDWTNFSPIPSDLPMRILLVEVNNGELVGEFDYLWTFDAKAGWPILKTPPAS